jgi:hypothetical protein
VWRFKHSVFIREVDRTVRSTAARSYEFFGGRVASQAQRFCFCHHKHERDSVAGLHSSVERFKLSTGMGIRWMVRLSNAFSKKLKNHQAVVALWIAFYNLCRVYESLRGTPAMALGVADHIWTIVELMQATLEPSDVPPLLRPAP